MSALNWLFVIAFGRGGVFPYGRDKHKCFLYSGILLSFGAFLPFAALGLLPLFERIFNIITAYRLSELTDHNRSLLKKLATVAPGTFNHSLAEGNLPKPAL
jgi:membrane-associated HD superfamily phosphohydrolase